MGIAITYDERYVVGCVIYGLKVVYENLPGDFFVIDHAKENIENRLLPGTVKIYGDWVEELVTPPTVVVSVNFKKGQPLGVGTMYHNEVNFQTNKMFNSIERGILTEGEISLYVVTHSIFESRSLSHKIQYIMSTPQFAYFLDYCGIILYPNARVSGPRVESEGDSVRYFVNTISYDFRSEWEVGETIQEDGFNIIRNVSSTIDVGFVTI